MAEDKDREPDRDTRHTIITTDGDGRGNAAIILLVALVAILLAVLFFGGVFDRDDQNDLNIDVNAPPDINLTLPETQTQPPPIVIPPETQTPPPDVNVNVTVPPTDDNLGNSEGVAVNGA
jgi:hypothetical protein